VLHEDLLNINYTVATYFRFIQAYNIMPYQSSSRSLEQKARMERRLFSISLLLSRMGSPSFARACYAREKAKTPGRLVI
jgi:hypothetical protein